MAWELALDRLDHRAILLSAVPVYVGRGPSNDLVLTDATVSTRHAAFWADSAGAHVEDLKSRNGTLINGRPLTGVASLKSGDTVRLGDTVELVVRANRRQNAVSQRGYLIVEASRGIAVPVRSTRVRIGPDAEPQLRVSAVDPVELVFRDDGIWVNRDGDYTSLALDTVVEIGDHAFQVRESKGVTAPTQETTDAPFPYVLDASLSGSRPIARLLHRETGAQLEVTAGTRVTLWWQLAQAVVRDRASGILRSEVGWCDARDLRVGVWGRSAADMEEKLNVLIHRARKELKDTGFDGAVIERRSAQVRAYVAEAKTT